MMLLRQMCLMLIALFVSGVAFAAGEAAVNVTVARPGATATVDRVIRDGKVLVSVEDAGKKPLLGLSIADFAVAQADRTAQVTSVLPLSESVEVPRHIVLVLDNSYSMEQRYAVKALLEGVGELLKTVRPIDDVQIVVFDSKKTVTVGKRKLRVQTFKSNNPAELRDMVAKAYVTSNLTTRTVLYEGMLAGLELVKKMPATEPRFMVVFSDGEDLNSAVKSESVLKAAQEIKGFNAYAIDFHEAQATDKFLTRFASQNRGQIWKAESEDSIVAIFQNVASKMAHYYVVNYEFPPPPPPVPPTGKLAAAPASLKVEEIKTIDASPMLGHIFFDKSASEIPARYVRFTAPAETAGFDEQKFTGTLDKYYQDLNIVGSRLTVNPAATVTLVGCNDNSGKEKGNRKLSTQRAEAVRDYLKTVWNIAPERMKIEARNLPSKPGSARMKEGQAENRRVEIISTDAAILAPIMSTYLTTRADSTTLTLRPEVVTPYGIATWTITAANGSGTLASLSGKGAPAKEISLPLAARDLKAFAVGGDIMVKMELQDSKGQNLSLSPEPVKVNFIQTRQLVAQKEGQTVQEKFALILFDFDKDTIGPQNQEIVNRIVGRIKTLPQAKVEIVGHTDNIGAEKYNQKLSERRALAVSKLLTAAYGEAPGDRIRHSGVGPNSPLFDNQSPEARSFNRTVTITLEYLSAE